MNEKFDDSLTTEIADGYHMPMLMIEASTDICTPEYHMQYHIPKQRNSKEAKYVVVEQQAICTRACSYRANQKNNSVAEEKKAFSARTRYPTAVILCII